MRFTVVFERPSITRRSLQIAGCVALVSAVAWLGAARSLVAPAEPAAGAITLHIPEFIIDAGPVYPVAGTTTALGSEMTLGELPSDGELGQLGRLRLRIEELERQDEQNRRALGLRPHLREHHYKRIAPSYVLDTDSGVVYVEQQRVVQ